MTWTDGVILKIFSSKSGNFDSRLLLLRQQKIIITLVSKEKSQFLLNLVKLDT
jgi:hypothetical protein